MQPGTLIALAEDRISELRCEADRQRRSLGPSQRPPIRFVALLRRRAPPR
jgi:hypothetical protein